MSDIRRSDTNLAAAQGFRIAEAIVAHSDAIVDALTEIATLDSVRTEIDDSVRLLRSATVEAPAYRRADPATPLRVYLPSNNALYSLSLFMLLPGLFLDDVLARPASRVKKQYVRLCEVLADHLPRGARLGDYTQREFVDLSHGATVVFNGRPENGYRIADSVYDATFLGFGAGPNPAVVGPLLTPGELTEACEAVVAARLYNNGQDCLCPDVVFVHASVVEATIRTLVASLETVEVTADLGRPGLISAPLSDQDSYDDFLARTEAVARHVVWTGGTTDHPHHAPITMSLRTMDALSAACPEYFGPMFDLVVYDRWSDVEDFLRTDEVASGGMYVFGFGEPALAQRTRIGTFRNTRGATPFEFEDGHRPFGGYGVRASWAHRTSDRPVGRPILLSNEVARATARDLVVAS